MGANENVTHLVASLRIFRENLETGKAQVFANFSSAIQDIQNPLNEHVFDFSVCFSSFTRNPIKAKYFFEVFSLIAQSTSAEENKSYKDRCRLRASFTF